MPGVGGTGVVTAAAILQMAAHLAGPLRRRARSDRPRPEGRPGDLRPAVWPRRRSTGQIRASRGGVDVLLGFDLLGAVTPQTIAVLDPERTVAILNTDVTPTASMVLDA